MAIKNPKTPRVTRKAKKTAAMYKKNPTWAKEDALGAYKKGGATKKMHKTGGMVNSNAKIAAAKKATGKVGGTSKAPKKALPKAQRGMSIESGKSTGAGKTITSNTPTITGGQKTKKVSYGPLVPGAKSSVTKTKTDRAGNMINTSTQMIDRKKAGNKINRMENKFYRKVN